MVFGCQFGEDGAALTMRQNSLIQLSAGEFNR